MNHWTITRNRPQTVRFPGGQREEARPYASSLVLAVVVVPVAVVAGIYGIGEVIWAISAPAEPGLSSLRDGAPAGLHQRLQSPIANGER